MRQSDVIFDSLQLLYYTTDILYVLYKINVKRGGSYIDSPHWIKKEKSNNNSKNKDDKCFQYVATVALNHKEIKRDPQRISKIKSFINKYYWNGIKYPSK